MSEATTNAETFLARLLDVKTLVETLTKDVIDAAEIIYTVEALDARKASRSRAYVRSTFALVEECSVS